MLLISESFVFIVCKTSPCCSRVQFIDVSLSLRRTRFGCYLKFLQLWWGKSAFTVLLRIRITLYYRLVLILGRLLELSLLFTRLLSIINLPIRMNLKNFVSTPLAVKFLTFLLTILQVIFLLWPKPETMLCTLSIIADVWTIISQRLYQALQKNGENRLVANIYSCFNSMSN